MSKNLWFLLSRNLTILNMYELILTLRTYFYCSKIYECITQNYHFGNFKKYLINLFLEWGGGKEKDWERNINVWFPLARPLLGTWPTTQACALTGNLTSNSLVHRPMLNTLSHTSQGPVLFFKPKLISPLLKEDFPNHFTILQMTHCLLLHRSFHSLYYA